MLHRPGRELARLTPTNKDDLLFDDVLWVKRARQEHDAFADTLEERGVEVLYLESMLADTLADQRVREEVIERTLTSAPLGPCLGPAVGEWLEAMPAAELAERLIAGITHDELPFNSPALAYQVTRVGLVRADAASQPPVHARHERVDLRRGQPQRDGEARPSAGGRSSRRDHPTPSELPAGRVR